MGIEIGGLEGVSYCHECELKVERLILGTGEERGVLLCVYHRPLGV